MRIAERTLPSTSLCALAAILLLGACEARPTVGQQPRPSEPDAEQASGQAPGGEAVVGRPAPLEQPPGGLAEFQSSFRAVAEAVKPLVVQIDVVEVVEQQVPEFMSPFEFFFGPRGQRQPREFRRPGLGSGVLVHQDSDTVYVLTNDHVVGEADEISVVVHDQSTHKGQLVGKDPRMDLALVSFTTPRRLELAAFGDSDLVRTGDWVLAVGNPLGLSSTITAGIISAVGRTEGPASSISEFLQTDAAINPGNSGGALVNIRGEVIGINTWIASPTGTFIGFGFAVPSNNAVRVLEELLAEGEVEYGWLGVSIRDPLPGTREDLRLGVRTGGLVVNLYDGSPADQAGFQPGDFITRINGTDVIDSGDLTRTVGWLSAGQRVEFEVIRHGESRSLSARVAERLSEEALAARVGNLWPGMVVIKMQDAPQLPVDRGTAVVAMAYQGTPAGGAGFRQGDVILEIDGQGIGDMMELYRHLGARPGAELRFRVLRQGQELLLRLPR